MKKLLVNKNNKTSIINKINNNNRFQTCRIIFIGESGVGKSNIISRFRYNTFEDSFLTTIGIDFHIKMIKIRGREIKLNIWDTAGHPKFREILVPYYKNVNVVCFCYDITNDNSIKNIDRWINEVRESINKNIILYAVGNKTDQNYYRSVNREHMVEYCNKNNINHIEVSAYDSTNINNLFYDIAFKYIDNMKPLQMNIETDNTYKKNTKCGDYCIIS